MATQHDMTTLDEIIVARLHDRARFTESDAFDRVHRESILSQSLLRNRMYRALTGTLSDAQMQRFLSEYYHGSIAGFLRRVMPLALAAYDEPLWTDYIRQIRIEESQPRNHALLFEEFLGSVDVPLLEPGAAAEAFVAASIEGYTTSLPFSCGYALAVEVEADYQIAVVADFARRHFGAQTVRDNIWFNTHLAETGEEEHARQTVEMACAMVRGAEAFAEFEAGFERACVDTERFMESIYDALTQEYDDA